MNRSTLSTPPMLVAPMRNSATFSSLQYSRLGAGVSATNVKSTRIHARSMKSPTQAACNIWWILFFSSLLHFTWTIFSLGNFNINWHSSILTSPIHPWFFIHTNISLCLPHERLIMRRLENILDGIACEWFACQFCLCSNEKETFFWDNWKKVPNTKPNSLNPEWV